MKKLLVKKVLSVADANFKRKDYEAAQKLYSSILTSFPKNQKALKGLSEVNKIISSTSRRLALQGSMNQLINNFHNENFKESVEQAKDLLRLSPNDVQILNILGASCVRLGNHDEAVRAFTNVRDLQPDTANAHYNLGNALKDAGNIMNAIECYHEALSIEPDYSPAMNNIFVALQTPEASKSPNYKKYSLLYELLENQNLTYLQRGAFFQEQGEYKQAIACYKKAITLEPNNAEACNSLGLLLATSKDPVAGLPFIKKAIKLNPHYAEAHNNLGLILTNLGRFSEASQSYHRALQINKNHSKVYANLGFNYFLSLKFEDALYAYQNALELDPNDAQSHHSLSYVLLAMGKFSEGFPMTEWRWKTKQRIGEYLKSNKPVWSGEKNRRVLVWGEQGIGDEIMFSSIIPDLSATCSQVILKCDKRLIPIFKRSFPKNVSYIDRSSAILEKDYDFHIPIGSLPQFYRKTRNSFDFAASGFLIGDEIKAQSFRQKLLQNDNKRLIGISWHSASPIMNVTTRNISLRALAQNLNGPNTHLVSLQYGNVRSEIEELSENYGIDVIQFDEVDNTNDIDGLAALMLACDDIVSTTSATVHLAGALGANTNVLLPYSPRWIWGSGSESFWYKSVKPIKQTVFGDWHSVLKALKSAYK